MLQGHSRALMELPVKEPFSQIIVLLRANVKKDLEATTATTKLKFPQYHKHPRTSRLVHRVQMISFQVSLLKRIRRFIYRTNSKVPQDEGVGDWVATGQCYFATIIGLY